MQSCLRKKHKPVVKKAKNAEEREQEQARKKEELERRLQVTLDYELKCWYDALLQ